MGKLLETLQSWLPRFKKSELEEDLDNSKTFLKDAIEEYANSLAVFKGRKLQSVVAVDLQNVYFEALGRRGAKSSLVEDVAIRLEQVLKNLEAVEKLFDKEISTAMLREGMTAKQIALVQAAEYFSFIGYFAPELLNYLYNLETQKMEPDLAEPVPLAQKQALFRKVIPFGALLRTFSETTPVFTQQIEDLPDVVVNATTLDVLAGQDGETSLAPFDKGIARGFVGNVYYHLVGMMKANWFADRYHRNKELKTQLQLRLLQLEELNQGNPTPSIQSQIDITSKRIFVLEEKIRNAEESVL